MTGQPLRLAQPGDMPAPRADSDSAAVLAEAAETLAALRTPYWHGDSAVGLHGPGQPHRSGAHDAPRRRSRGPRPRPHLDRDRPVAQSLPGNRSPPIPDQSMINLTKITHIMAEHRGDRLQAHAPVETGREHCSGRPEYLSSESAGLVLFPLAGDCGRGLGRRRSGSSQLRRRGPSGRRFPAIGPPRRRGPRRGVVPRVR
jgi:hypothetical protein